MIEKISQNTKNAIMQKSAYGLPDRPSDVGMTSSDIKKAFYQPIIDMNNSSLAEIDRVIDESNAQFQHIEETLNNISTNIDTRMEELDSLVTINQENSQTLTRLSNEFAEELTVVDSFIDTLSDVDQKIENLFQIYEQTFRVTDWQDCQYAPYKFNIEFNMNVEDVKIVELVNDNPILFAEYGFSIFADVDTYRLLALEKPTEAITLKFNVIGKNFSITV